MEGAVEVLFCLCFPFSRELGADPNQDDGGREREGREGGREGGKKGGRGEEEEGWAVRCCNSTAPTSYCTSLPEGCLLGAAEGVSE